MCILYAFYFRHTCVFYFIIIIMFWGVIRKYVSLNSICAKRKGEMKGRVKKGGLTQTKEKEKGEGGFHLHDIYPREKGQLLLLSQPQTHAQQREERREKKKKKRRSRRRRRKKEKELNFDFNCKFKMSNSYFIQPRTD